MRIASRRRRGVSVVVAQLLMIVIVLIVGVVLGGFTFGLLGTYAAPAIVSAQTGTCSASGTIVSCQLILFNQGTHSTSTTGACVINEGSAVQGSVVGGGVVPADGSLSGVQCVANGSTLSTGTSVSGALSLTNGAVLYFAGTLQ